jgi:hypothetical protein
VLIEDDINETARCLPCQADYPEEELQKSYSRFFLQCDVSPSLWSGVRKVFGFNEWKKDCQLTSRSIIAIYKGYTPMQV